MSNWVFIGVIILVAVVVLLPRMNRMPASKAKSLLETGALLVDVRSPAEFQSGSAEGAINIPVGNIRQHLQDRAIPKEQALLLFCASGTRSAMAKRQLAAEGYSKVHNLGTVAQARKLSLSSD